MPPAPPDSDAPRCGQCHYIVRGITSLTCPECGSDLREVGIDVGRRRPSGWGPVVLIAIVWGVLIAIIAQMMWESARRHAPRTADLSYKVMLQKPASGQYLQLTIEGSLQKPTSAEAYLLTDEVLPDVKLVLLGEQGKLGTLTIDLAADTCTYTTPSGAGSAPQSFFGPVTLQEWLSRCTGKSSPQLQTEATEIAALLRSSPNQHRGVLNIRNGSMSGGSSSSGTTSTSTWSLSGEGTFGMASGTAMIMTRLPIWYAVGVALGSLGLWLVVVVWLVRRLTRGPTTAPSPQPA